MYWRGEGTQPPPGSASNAGNLSQVLQKRVLIQDTWPPAARALRRQLVAVRVCAAQAAAHLAAAAVCPADVGGLGPSIGPTSHCGANRGQPVVKQTSLRPVVKQTSLRLVGLHGPHRRHWGRVCQHGPKGRVHCCCGAGCGEGAGRRRRRSLRSCHGREHSRAGLPRVHLGRQRRSLLLLLLPYRCGGARAPWLEPLL